MKMTVVGAGAIGGTVAAHLLRDGHDVLLCDADAAHVAAINARGLRITGPVEEFTVAARAVLPEDLPPSIERAVVAVKSHHTAAAAKLLRDRLDPDGYVLSLQNGLTFDTIAAQVGAERVSWASSTSARTGSSPASSCRPTSRRSAWASPPGR